MLSKQAVKNLRRVEKFLFNEPRRFNMAAGVEASAIHEMKEQPVCGTACCIGGAAYLLKNKINLKKLVQPLSLSWARVSDNATLFLDLDHGQRFKLFHVQDWPESFRNMYNAAESAHELAAVGILRIEHFIKTGGNE